MGTGISAAAVETPGADLRLPETKLRYTVTQLRALNSYIDTLHAIDKRNGMSLELENTVESLVQRIVDGAGQKDPRFRCCHLIALHREKKMRSRSLEYLVTLDSLPIINSGDEECVLVEGPPGYGKLRLSGRTAQRWDEFLTPAGYLCRERVVERWVELVASSARGRGGGSSRVVSAGASTRAAPYTYCYLETRSSNGSASQHRLAIVEGAAWVMVRVGAGRAEAKLVIGVRAAGSTATTYTSRIPLTHPMALLHYTAAQTGFFAVAVGPPSSLTCSDRQASWQLWHPALEASLDSHISDFSTTGRIAGALNGLIDRLRDGVVQGSLRVLSRYAVSCAWRRRMDRNASSVHTAARFCAGSHASHHLLLILDSLIAVCEKRHPAGYVYMLERDSCARRAVRTVEADWKSDAACLRNYLHHLHVETIKASEIPPTLSEELETMLFKRWENIVRESRVTTQSSGGMYCRRQLRYISKLVTELVNYKKNISCNIHSVFRVNLINATSLDQEPIEDLIHILAIMLDQARDCYLVNNLPQNSSAIPIDREHLTYRSKKWNKLKDYYDASSTCLIDAVRRDIDLRNEDLSHNLVCLKNVLNWLYKGAKDDKKYLGPVLKPYLEGLYNSSLENSWFLEDFESKKCLKEYEGLEDFCSSVHDGRIDPRVGLLDASKKLSWAKAMVEFIDRSKNIVELLASVRSGDSAQVLAQHAAPHTSQTPAHHPVSPLRLLIPQTVPCADLRLVFPTGDGMAISFAMTLPLPREHRALSLNRGDKAEAKLRLAKRAVLAAFSGVLLGNCEIPSMTRQNSTDEILNSVKNGQYWRNSTKPDIIPATKENKPNEDQKLKRRSRRRRPATVYGFPEISSLNQTDSKAMKKKYHTLRNLVYKEQVETVRELRERSKSATTTLRMKEATSRPNMLETLDFINGVKDALCVDESSTSDMEDFTWGADQDWLLGQSAPLNTICRLCQPNNTHLALGDLISAMLYRGKFTVLQELCSWLGESGEGALFALHRLARAARSRSSDRATNNWKLPEAEGVSVETDQKYKARPPDYFSGDEAPPPPPPPPPLPRKRTNIQPIPKERNFDYNPPKRMQDLEQNLNRLEIMNSKLKNTNVSHCNNNINEPYTGIINPIYDEKKIPREKFLTKRSKSLGRNFSTRRLGLEITRYNITLGHKSTRSNDVLTAIMGATENPVNEHKSNFFQKYSNSANVSGDSYRLSKVTIE